MFHVKQGGSSDVSQVETPGFWMCWCGPNLFVMPATKQSIHKVIHSGIHSEVHTLRARGCVGSYCCCGEFASPHYEKGGPRLTIVLAVLLPFRQSGSSLAACWFTSRPLIA